MSTVCLLATSGLLIALRMKSWDSSTAGYLKLSSVLEMYYSDTGIHGDSKYRGCNRLFNYRDSTLIDKNLLKEQSLNAALIMYSRGIDGAPNVLPGVTPADQIGRYVNTTMTEINDYIEQSANTDQDFTQCKGAYVATTSDPTPETYTDLTFVFDQTLDSRGLQNQKDLAGAIALGLDIQKNGSRMEVVSGKDGNPFIDLDVSRNRAELACKFSNLQIGYAERRVADSLDRTRSRILTERSSEKANKIGGSNKRSILFFVSNSIAAEKEKIKNVLLRMLNEMPDVHIMFATMSSPEELRPYVANFERDIIQMNKYLKYTDAAPEIVQRLATVGARLSYPECRDISSSSNATEARYLYSGLLNAGSTQYFRLGTEQFYSSNVLFLRFQSTYGVARYCVSTSKERPGSGDNCKNAVKAGDTVEFKFNQPCARMIPSQCSNIYISATPIAIDDNIPCSEQDCHTPDQVKFTFSHSGMRCNSAVAGAVFSHSTLVVVLMSFIVSWFLSR